MELILRQVLVIPDVPLFETCVISEPKQLSPQASNTVVPVNGSKQSGPGPDSNTKNHLGYNDLETSQPEPEVEQEQEPEVEPEVEQEVEPEQEREREIKHFGFTEVEIDFDNIPDTIDTNEPNFSTATTTTNPESSASNSKEGTTMIASIKLKKHKDVLYEMYKVAKKKAQEAKKVAIRTYLEAKEIKAAYLLDNSDLSDSDDDV